MNLSLEPQSLHYCQGYIFRGAGERNRGYALLMTANKPETALYRAPTFSLLLASHGGINAWKIHILNLATVGVTEKLPLPFTVHRFLAILPAGRPASRSVSKRRARLLAIHCRTIGTPFLERQQLENFYLAIGIPFAWRRGCTG